MQLGLLVLTICMLLTGTINTLATKFQDLVEVGKKPDGSPQMFFHPAFQSACMFLGELLCLVPYSLSYLYKRSAEQRAESAAASEGDDSSPIRRPLLSRTGSIIERRAQAHSIKALVSFSIPAICDALGTTLLNLGLFYTYASAYQMLRGTLVFFAGLLTIALLKRRLHVHHWMGMVLIVAGAAMVGVASMVGQDFEPYDPDEGPMAGGGGAGVDDDYGAGGDVSGSISRMLFMGRRGLKSLVLGHKDGGGGDDDNASRPLLGNVLVVMAQLAAASQFIIEEKYLTQYRVPALLAVGLEGFWGLVICAIACPVLSLVHVNGQPIDSWAQALRDLRRFPVLAASTGASIVSIAFFNSFGVKVTKRLSGAARAAIDACRTIFIWAFSLYWGWEPTSPPLRIALQVTGFVVLLSGTSLYNELLRSCLPAPTSPPPGAREAEHGHGYRQRQQATAAAAAADGNHRPPSAPQRVMKPSDSYTLARSIRMLPQVLSPHSLSSFGRWVRGSGGNLRNNDSSASLGPMSYEDGSMMGTPSASVGIRRWDSGGDFGSAPSSSAATPLLGNESDGDESAAAMAAGTSQAVRRGSRGRLPSDGAGGAS